MSFNLASPEFFESSIISITLFISFVALDKPSNISSFSRVFFRK